jgi:hypothetical protein
MLALARRRYPGGSRQILSFPQIYFYNNMEQKIITSGSAHGLNEKIEKAIVEGWKPLGSHQVVVKHSQNRFAGTQHRDTIHELEYSQTLVKDEKDN